ncbi:MAG: hypothetical protein AVO33_00020 [delta proteobacterium ML8_F1]|nr:MAG: hypothetical protein AVO33_00020 [delta proteobacterium ML8_F1]
MPLPSVKRLLPVLGGISLLPFLVPLARPSRLPEDSPFPESRYLTYEGITLHYRDFEARGEVFRGRMLLVHGVGGSTDSFRFNFEALSRAGYRVVAVDFPGFGYSERSEAFDHRQTSRARLLWEVADALSGKEASWHLLGHSMGGGVVTAMAAMAPQRTRRVILVGGSLEGSGRLPDWLLEIPPLNRTVRILLERFLIKEKPVKAFLTSVYGRPPTETEVLGFFKPLRIAGTSYGVVSVLRTRGNLPLEAYEGLGIFVTGIWGERDSWVRPSEGAAYGRLFENYDFHVIPGAAHSPMETHPEDFNDLLLKKLQGGVTFDSNQ